jgi:predicted nucleic acid-binding protein
MGRIYLLDTNIISYLTDPQSPHRTKVKEKLFSLSEDDSVAVSILTLYELAYGLATFKESKKDDKKLFQQGIEFVKEYLDIFPLSVEEIDIFGEIKTKYKKQTGINTKALKKNDIDFLIASTAISQGAILVSNDGVFGDIVDYEVGLEFEVWV